MSRVATGVLVVGASLAVLVALLLAWLLDSRLPAGLVSQDLDGSGTLSREQAGPLLRRDFDAIDRDGSGELVGRELRRHVIVDALSRRSRALPVPAYPTVRDASGLRAWLESPVHEGRLRGVGLIVLSDGEPVFEHSVGDLDPQAAQPLGTATMWPTALMMGCLDERGVIELSAPLEASDPSLPPGWAPMTPMKLLSHTAGAPGIAGADFPPETNLETAARALMVRYSPELPGRAFRFGGAGLQVLGWLAEANADRPWRRLFVECLGWPLSLDSAAWGHPVTGPRNQGFLSPGLGLHLSMEDYSRILAMVQQSGRFAGVAILGEDTLVRLEQERMGMLPRMEEPRWAASEWGYAAGAWCESRDEEGRCRRFVAPGSYGMLPWLDRDRGLAGVLVTLDSPARVWNWLLATRALAEQTHFD
ncbi:MAG: class A beta-lactamase-related serine hydrolase [Gammaproteobacteria bacterium]|nr:MAG: class A beta-lactamase-related serine hydrolase [Gammaproteobacteria bacterium]